MQIVPDFPAADEDGSQKNVEKQRNRQAPDAAEAVVRGYRLPLFDGLRCGYSGYQGEPPCMNRRQGMTESAHGFSSHGAYRSARLRTSANIEEAGLLFRIETARQIGTVKKSDKNFAILRKNVVILLSKQAGITRSSLTATATRNYSQQRGFGDKTLKR